MISNEDLDDPPQVSMITGAPKQQKHESLTEALTGASTAFAKVFNTTSSVYSDQPPTFNSSAAPCKLLTLE